MIEQDNTTLTKQVRKAAQELGYQGEEGFILKVIQLKDILVVRHCMFIIGPPGSGKTSVWKCLARQEVNEGHETACQIINPKSVDSDELFGYMTPSLEW